MNIVFSKAGILSRALLCLFALALTPTQAALAEQNGRDIAFGSFTLKITPGQAGLLDAQLLRKGAAIAPRLEALREISADPIQADFPLPGCQTMKISLFTGGANCCFGYYLLSSGQGRDYAAYLEPGDGGLGDSNIPGAYAATDGAFMYYEKKDGQGNAISLNRVESPRLPRLLVFDRDSWRADRPGEFKAAYAAYATPAPTGDSAQTARAITGAYARLMAGENEASVLASFSAALPAAHKPLAEAAFADIRKALAAFSPAVNIPIK